MEIRRNKNKIVAIVIITAILLSAIFVFGNVFFYIAKSNKEEPKMFDLRTMSCDMIELNNLEDYDAIVGYEEQILNLSQSENIRKYVENGGDIIVAMDTYKNGSIGYLVEEINDNGLTVSNINGNLLLEKNDSIDTIDYDAIDYTEVVSELKNEDKMTMAASSMSGNNYDYGTQSKSIMRSHLINKNGNIAATMIITVVSHRLGAVGDVSAWAQVIYVDITPGSKTGIYSYQVADFEIGLVEFGDRYLDHYVDNGEAKTITMGTTIGSDSSGNMTVSNTYSATYTAGSLDIARRHPVIDGNKNTIWVCKPNERVNGRPFSAVVGGVYKYGSKEDVGTALIYIQNVRVVSSPWGRSFECEESKDSNQKPCATIIHSYKADASARTFILGITDSGNNKGTVVDLDDGEYQVYFENATAQRDKYGPIYNAVP